MRLPIVDGDGHVLEPLADILTGLPAGMRERALGWRAARASRRSSGSDIEYSTGSLCTPGALAAGGRLDIDFASEVDRGVDDPGRRLALMDEQGIAVSLIFPTMLLGLDEIFPDPGLRTAVAALYNDWICAFCGADPLRLRWAAVLPLARRDQACAELERVLAAGASAVMISPFPCVDGATLGDSANDPVFARIAEARLPVVIHAGDQHSEGLGMSAHWTSRARWQMGVPIQLQLAVLSAIDGGLLERFPALEIGFFEGDVGWLAHWLGRLDQTYTKMALVSRVPRRSALEQFRSQCVISGEPADLGLALTARTIGADRVLFASDWPHQDGAWPDPIRLLCARTDLTDAEKRSILVDGPARFFRIELDEVLQRLGPGWSRGAPLEAIPGLLEGGLA